MTSQNYIIVTPAYNESAYIERTIQSVLVQTTKPRRWIIVDDGSTDHTAEIVKRHAKKYSWIHYIYRTKNANTTYYSSNVYAILHGLQQILNENSEIESYDYIAVLDADIELCTDYYEKIFEKYKQYPQLGVTTGTYLEKEGNCWIKARIDRRSTPKAIQVFRRECYETCGGYIPFKYGGEDSGMEIMARMNGWQTWSFDDIAVKHLRPVGTGDGRSIIRARYRMGFTDYCLSTHPFFMLFKCIRRSLWEKPYFLSGFARLAGYLMASLSNTERQLPSEAQSFVRAEQINRLLNAIKCGKKMWKPE